MIDPSLPNAAAIESVLQHFQQDPGFWHLTRKERYAWARDRAIEEIEGPPDASVWGPEWVAYCHVVRICRSVPAPEYARKTAMFTCLALLAWPDSIKLFHLPVQAIEAAPRTPASILLLPVLHAVAGTVPQRGDNPEN